VKTLKRLVFKGQSFHKQGSHSILKLKIEEKFCKFRGEIRKISRRIEEFRGAVGTLTSIHKISHHPLYVHNTTAASTEMCPD